MKNGFTFIIVIAAAGAGYAATGYRPSPRMVRELPDHVNAAGLVVRVYDVHGLIERQLSQSNDRFDNPGAASPPASLPESLPVQSQGMQSNQLFRGSMQQAQQAETVADVESELGDDLAHIIEANVPGCGGVRYAAGMLIVEHSAEAQKQVADVLDRLDTGRGTEADHGSARSD